MNLPPEGLCVPCTYDYARDGDTIVVVLRTGQTCAVRLIDCWAPERRTKEGRAAKRFVEEWMDNTAMPLHAWFPLPGTGSDGRVDITDLLKSLTFDRVPGRLFVGTRDMSEELVLRGYAYESREKQDEALAKATKIGRPPKRPPKQSGP